MSDLVRISMSLESSLLERFDQLLQEEGYPTRSEAIKALMRHSLTEKAWTKDELVAGSITLVYDHHRRGTADGGRRTLSSGLPDRCRRLR